MFQILKQKGRARSGILKTYHGEIRTPFFMPIATRGAVKNLTPEELKDLGAEIILSNTYHLLLKPGITVIKKAGGLHQFMGWLGPILTDSGGFQVFSLAKMRKIKAKGVKFCSEADGGKKHFLTPEAVLEIQRDLGVDLAMILDVCAPYPCAKKEAEKAVNLTTEWAKRSLLWLSRNPNFRKKTLVFGIVQGSIYRDLRLQSVRDITKLDFDGYALGGLAVGEPIGKMYQVLDYVVQKLPKAKPRYLMGAGKPENILEAVKRGIDMFDCVIPTREARHGRIYKFKVKSACPAVGSIVPVGARSPRPWGLAGGETPPLRALWLHRALGHSRSQQVFYEIIKINNANYREDFKPIDQYCSCYTCQNFTRAYLNHLFRLGEPLGLRLATIHNLKFYLDLMERIREEIIKP